MTASDNPPANNPEPLNGIDLGEMRTHAGEASRLLKALANENRLMILCRLAEGEVSVGALAQNVGLSQSALSQHLALLRRDGLVRTRRKAQTIFYSLSGDEANRVIEVLHSLYCEPTHI